MKKLFWGMPLAALLLASPAMASGVSLSVYGNGGGACYQPYAGEESFGSGNLSGSTYLSYSGSAIGFDNTYPGGCPNSPIEGHWSASGTAEPGLLKASAHADGELQTNFGFGDATVNYSDTFTAISGGTYLLTFTLDGSLSASPACPGGVTTDMDFTTYLSAGNTFGRITWDSSDCSPNTPVNVYGNYTLINPDEVVFPVYEPAGGSFNISGGLHVHAGLGGYNATDDASYGDTAILDITGQNGATYSMASGVTYDATDAPEPATWLLAAFALYFVRPTGRRSRS
jgi:hypothetical protein